MLLHNDAIIKAYQDVSGHVPGKPETDNGAAEPHVLKYWRKNGIGGHRTEAFVALEPGNRHHILAASYLFGGCFESFLQAYLPDWEERECRLQATSSCKPI